MVAGEDEVRRGRGIEIVGGECCGGGGGGSVGGEDNLLTRIVGGEKGMMVDKGVKRTLL